MATCSCFFGLTPKAVTATKMDVNNYAIVFTPGFLRSQSVDLAAMANSQFENEFTVRIVTLVRAKYPDDSVGDPQQVPKPYVPPSLTSSHDLRVLITATPETKRPEDIMREAEERLKNAKKDLHDAKKMEIKEQKKGGAVASAVGVSLRKSSLTKTEGGRVAERLSADRTPPPKELKKSAKSPREDMTPPKIRVEETPPRPSRLPPPLVSPNLMDSGTVAQAQHAQPPALPTLPPELPALPPQDDPEPPLPSLPPPPLPTVLESPRKSPRGGPSPRGPPPAVEPAARPSPRGPETAGAAAAAPSPVQRAATPDAPVVPPALASLVSPRVISTPFEQFLADAKVLDYIDAFHDYGIETIDDLRGLEEDDLNSIGLKPTYREGLVQMLATLKTPAVPLPVAAVRTLKVGEDDERSDHSDISPEVSRGDSKSPDAARADGAKSKGDKKHHRRRRKSKSTKQLGKEMDGDKELAMPPPPPEALVSVEAVVAAAEKLAAVEEKAAAVEEKAAPEAKPAEEKPVDPPSAAAPPVPTLAVVHQADEESSDGLSSSEGSPRVARQDLSELKILLEELMSEIEHKNDMGVLRGARSCAAKAMEVVQSASGADEEQAREIEKKVAAINAGVVTLVKSEHSPEAAQSLIAVIREAEALF